MKGHLDELYLTWLFSEVGSVRAKNPSNNYWKLMRQLYTKEFVWFVPNDDNRSEDGKDLRYEFIEDQRFDTVDPDWMNLGCSVLEMLLGLSRRLTFEAGGKSREWFWILLENIELDRCNETWYDKTKNAKNIVDEILERVIWRTYEEDGSLGGLFPLTNPQEDQRKVELWYQMCAYILEQD